MGSRRQSSVVANTLINLFAERRRMARPITWELRCKFATGSLARLWGLSFHRSLFAKMLLLSPMRPIRGGPGIDVDRLIRSYLEIIPSALFDQGAVLLAMPRPSIFLVADTKVLAASTLEQAFTSRR
jgi:hypothetical protein